MATRFNTTASRLAWTGLFIGIAADFALAFVLTGLFSDLEGIQLIGASAVILIAVYLFQAMYGLWRLGKAFALFHLFDREARIGATVKRMVDLDLPPPDDFYLDPLDYIHEVAVNEDASDAAKVFAGAIIGGIEAHRSTGRGFLYMSSVRVLEAAIERYSTRFHPR